MSIPLPPPMPGPFIVTDATARKLNEFFTKSGGERQRCRYGAPGASGCNKGYAATASKKTGRVCCVKARAKAAAAAPKKRTAPRKATKKTTRKAAKKTAARKRVASHLYF